MKDLNEIMAKEQHYEAIKIQLAKQPDFSVGEVMTCITRGDSFTFDELMAYLKSLRVSNLSKQALTDVYSFFDSSPSVRFGSHELGEMLVPYDLQEVDLQKKGKMSPQTVKLTKEAFEGLLASFLRLNQMRKLLGESKIDIQALFNSFQLSSQGFIQMEYMVEKIEKLEGKTFQYEIGLNALMRKCDIDQDGQISYKDFYLFFSA